MYFLDSRKSQASATSPITALIFFTVPLGFFLWRQLLTSSCPLLNHLLLKNVRVAFLYDLPEFNHTLGVCIVNVRL